MINDVVELGYIEKGTGKHQSNLVFSVGGVAPCVMAMFGVKQPPTMVVVKDNNERSNKTI